MPEQIPVTTRLNKRMAELGLCSRREADEWIARGWVKVNGRVAQMGLQVAAQDRIEVDRQAQGQQRQQVTILLHKPVQVQFERVGENGFIQNTISDSDTGLWLAFTFGLNFPGTEPGSAAEQAKGDEMKHAYIGAVGATLDRVRQLVRDGAI